MEASTLRKKKNTINKGKMKKSIKNVICRPDPLFWPEATVNEEKRLELILGKYKIDLPEFQKPHWKDLKLIPKDQRPKPPKLEKRNGMLFGIIECNNAIKSEKCSAVIIEASVNPRMIVQPVIEACTHKQIPFICMNNLRKLCSAYFGIRTSCFGIECNTLLDIKDEVLSISKSHLKSQKIIDKDEKINVSEESNKDSSEIEDIKITECPYLYRTNKKSRVFIPTASDKILKVTRKFVGQDFIEFSNKQEKSKQLMTMILKRISNNADRTKKK